jgi:hypothetical protein
VSEHCGLPLSRTCGVPHHREVRAICSPRDAFEEWSQAPRQELRKLRDLRGHRGSVTSTAPDNTFHINQNIPRANQADSGPGKQPRRAGPATTGRLAWETPPSDTTQVPYGDVLSKARHGLVQAFPPNGHSNSGNPEDLLDGPDRSGKAHQPHCRRPQPTWPSVDPSIPARWCDIHHIAHWVDHGPTSLHNCVALCGRHHRLLHHSHWRIHMVSGIPQFHRPPWLGGPPRTNPLHTAPNLIRIQ